MVTYEQGTIVASACLKGF